MPSPVLTMAAQLTCPHGAPVVFVPTNSKVLLGGSPALTSADMTTVVGCPFVVVLKPQPCVLVQWTPGPSKVGAGGTQVLTMESVGICFSADGIPAGPVIKLSPGQTAVRA